MQLLYGRDYNNLYPERSASTNTVDPDQTASLDQLVGCIVVLRPR